MRVRLLDPQSLPSATIPEAILSQPELQSHVALNTPVSLITVQTWTDQAVHGRMEDKKKEVG